MRLIIIGSREGVRDDLRRPCVIGLSGMSPGRDIVQEKYLPRRSEYERSAIDFVRCFSSKKDNHKL